MQTCRCYGCMEKIHSYPCEKCAYDPEKVQLQEYILQPGTILKGQYLVGRVLGQGGFGITYIGWDLALQRKVAVKEYFPSSYAGRKSGTQNVHWFATEQAELARSSGMEMFLKEARKMSRVNEIENVVHVLDLFQENNTAYIVMDFIEGETLKARVKREGPLEWKDAQKLFFPVIHTMGQVHQAGLIHRDLSPDNLMLQSDGSAKILDLGAAKDLNINTGASSMQVAKGGFSPLEQYTQRGESGTWSDVYAMAATMYMALTGIVPPSAIDRMTKDTLDFSLPQCRKLPSRVVKALKHALMVRPGERTRTMEEFALELSGKHGKANSGSRRVLAAGVTVAMVCACLVGLRCIRWQKTETPAPTLAETESIPLTEEAEPTVLQDTATEPDSTGWEKNVLKLFPGAGELEPVAYGAGVMRKQIRSVMFLDNLDTAPQMHWDVSEAQDGSVLAWVVMGSGDSCDMFIAAEGGVNGVRSACALFQYYTNLETVRFGGNYHTEQAEDLRGMFMNCFSLKTVDVENLDVSNAQRMNAMFGICRNLEELDLSGWDTRKVTDMNSMFTGCKALKELDLSSFDTSKVTSMRRMFAGCSSLEKLDLEQFDFGSCTDMAEMFLACESLKEIQLPSFQGCQPQYMDRMFMQCPGLPDLEIRGLDVTALRSYRDFMDVGGRINGRPWEEFFE